jgi:1-acyl-sn-glycerol-3-phosphate acyltransferase
MGFSGAFFIIPLNAFLQNRAEPKECSRIIAATNIMNAIFMLAAAGVVIILNAFQLSSQSIFGVVAVLNILVSVYMFSIIPEFTMRFIVWFLASTIYRLKYSNRLALPKHGPAIIVSNHVSYIDWFIIAAACRRPVRFVMYYKFFEAPILNWFFRMGKAIPIASAKENEGIKTKAFSQIQWELRDDNPIYIFPEGTLTTTGDLETFRGGVEEIQKQNPGVPVMTLFLHGLWGSYFSRSGGKAMAKLPKPKWRVIEVEFGQTFNNFVSAVELQNYYTKHLKTRVDHQES